MRASMGNIRCTIRSNVRTSGFSEKRIAKNGRDNWKTNTVHPKISRNVLQWHCFCL